MKTALAFDDVLLVPQYNEIASRKDVDISTRLSKRVELKLPIISSCMDTVTGVDMAITMWRAGGLGMLHRYNTIEQQVEMFLKVKGGKKKDEELVLFDKTPEANCAVAIGATGDYFDRAVELIKNGVDILCIDVAHGDSKIVVDALVNLRKFFSEATIIAGNVATGEGCARLIDAGADAIRAGVGSGAACTTRIQAGSGVPTLETLFDCKQFLQARGLSEHCVIADGGIKLPGDFVKSLAAGAGAVMLGQLLAATDEAPGDIVELRGSKYKSYRGMSSVAAQVEWRPEKEGKIVPEGAETLLPYKGSVKQILFELEGGLRSGMTYSGARTLTELKDKAKFVQITSAGWAESKPHAKDNGV